MTDLAELIQKKKKKKRSNSPALAVKALRSDTQVLLVDVWSGDAVNDLKGDVYRCWLTTVDGITEVVTAAGRQRWPARKSRDTSMVAGNSYPAFGLPGSSDLLKQTLRATHAATNFTPPYPHTHKKTEVIDSILIA